jgi:ADP-ribose pyrophosphatase YjhB (NUDIX family)
MIINYCLECAQPLSRKTPTQYTCPAGHDFWNNPRTTVAVVILKDDQILVSKRAREPFKGQYDLPGGFLEYGEDPYDAVIRETREETGLLLERSNLRILTAYTGPYWENESLCDIVVLATDWSGAIVASDDSAALTWQELSFLTTDQFCPPYPGLGAIIESNQS